jgi:phosphate transport system permease protein
LPFVQESVVVGEEGRTNFSVVINPSLRMGDITYGELREIYLGLTGFWGYLSGQNRNITPYVAADERFRSDVGGYLLDASGIFGPNIGSVDSPEAMVEAISEDGGAVALVPTDWVTGQEGVELLGLRQVSVVVHPEVVALQAGRRLDSIDEDQLSDLFSGGAVSWSDVGGPAIEIEPADVAEGVEGEYQPLPVRPVVLSESAPANLEVTTEALRKVTFAENTTFVDSMDAFAERLRTTPGSVGVVRAREVRSYELAPLEVEFVTHSMNLRPSFLVSAPSRAGAVGGISSIILNTVAMVFFVLGIATPIGVSAAVYLVEYAKQGRLLTVLRIGTDTLAGIPSIIFGLFGMVFFSQFLGLQTGLLAGSFTLTLMILPTVVRTSEEALRSVPTEIREGSLALGATKLQTIVRTVIPAASPGILTGVILGIGRAIGETAVLLFTMGSNLAVVRSLNSPIRVLSVHLYLLIRENISIPNAFATATILVVIVFIVNFTTRRLISRMYAMGAH